MKLFSKLIRNENGSIAAVKPIQSLTCNFLPNLVRHDTLEDRNFLVVPMVILTEGVHNGSGGPLFYPGDELSKTPAAWNHKPIVVYHPEINGQGVSACDPVILNNRKVGIMMNTTFQKGRLKSEAWIDKDRANKVDDRIMAAIEASEMMELSTGVFVDQEDKEGEWNGETYAAIARNYRPDHLALLPDKIGACSIADGAGFLRNEKSSKLSTLQTILKKMGVILENEMSHDNIRSSLSEALRARLTVQEDGPWLYVEDVYSNFVIYSLDGKLYRVGYTVGDTTGVVISEDAPKEVVRVTEYRTIEGAYVGNHDQQKPIENKNAHMDKNKMVDAIIANGWSEADRPALIALNEEQLKAIMESKIRPTTVTPEPPPSDNAPSQNAEVVTLEDYIKNAPKEIAETLMNSHQLFAEEKTRLVDGIIANKNNSFKKEDLSNRPLGELRALAKLAAVERPAPNYSGMAPTGNNEEEPLLIPTINFGK
jgi:hypothetical protein